MEEMPKEYGAQSLDHNELAAALAGSAIVSGCAASDGTNSMEVDVASGTAIVDGSKVSVSAQTVTLSSADGTYPRKDVVYIDSTGSAAVAQGVAEEAEPSNVTGRDTYRPSPEDLSSTAAAVVAEVWVAAGVSDIGSGDITDRRSMPNLPSEYLQSHPFGLSDLNNPFGLPAISDMDAAGNDLVDGTTTVWDTSAGAVPQGQLGGPAASLSAYPLVQGTDNDSAIDMGYVTAPSGQTLPYTQTITTGFQPRFVEFFARRHPAGFNSEFDSGDNTGEANAFTHSIGYAASTATGDQLVSCLGAGSNSTNGHLSYVGDGEVVYLITTDGTNSVVNGRGRANLSSINADGFDLEWTAAYESYVVLYRAYR